MNLNRRHFAVFAAGAAIPVLSHSQQPVALTIGYPNTGLPLIAKNEGSLATRLAAQGIAVRWAPFSTGPAVIEALNLGHVHLALAGAPPAIFAQAAGATSVLYAGALPQNGKGEALIVKEETAFTQLGDLKGRRIGYTKNSGAHDFVAAAIEQVGMTQADFQHLYLAPGDAAAAFAGDQIDAWAIWDPLLAATESQIRTRTLVSSDQVRRSNTFILVNAEYVRQHADGVRNALSALAEVADWAQKNPATVAKTYAKETGVSEEAVLKWLSRVPQGPLIPVDASVANDQQQLADRFRRMGLISRDVRVSQNVWAWR